jgi:hypothetical protein
VKKDKSPKIASELLADWRAAGRDTAAAMAASEVASLTLEAAKAADDAASETEAAATAAASAVELALKAAASAKRAAQYAANAAHVLIASAEGDKVRASHQLEEAKKAEEKTRLEFHDSQLQGFPQQTETEVTGTKSEPED